MWRLMRYAWVKNIAVPESDATLKVKGQMVSMAIGAWPAPLVLSKLPVQTLKEQTGFSDPTSEGPRISMSSNGAYRGYLTSKQGFLL